MGWTGVGDNSSLEGQSFGKEVVGGCGSPAASSPQGENYRMSCICNLSYKGHGGPAVEAGSLQRSAEAAGQAMWPEETGVELNSSYYI